MRNFPNLYAYISKRIFQILVDHIAAFKKPVISTKSHGIPYTVQDQKTGILVEPENPNQLADAIKKLLDDDDLRMII